MKRADARRYRPAGQSDAGRGESVGGGEWLKRATAHVREVASEQADEGTRLQRRPDFGFHPELEVAQFKSMRLLFLCAVFPSLAFKLKNCIYQIRHDNKLKEQPVCCTAAAAAAAGETHMPIFQAIPLKGLSNIGRKTVLMYLVFHRNGDCIRHGGAEELQSLLKMNCF